MKTSQYNFLLENGDRYILYNACSDEIVILQPELYDLYVEHLNSIDKLAEKHAEFFNYLVEKQAIVPDDEDESLKVIEQWKEKEEQSDTFSFTVNPTLGCNMNCWYCYEKRKDSVMSDAVAERVARSMESLCREEPRYKRFALSFFGGEPLLYFDTVVKGLIARAREICGRYGKGLSLHFTTNGYLIDEAKLAFLDGTPVSFQITLDGNAYVHNKVKKTADSGGDTYHPTLERIRLCLRHGFRTSVRLNFTEASLPFFLDVVSDFKDVPADERAYLTFNLQRVWQDASDVKSEVLEKHVRRIENAFLDRGFAVSPYTSNTVGRCYADDDCSVTVNYDGNLFKCTARDFAEENKDGILDEAGRFLWNENHAKRRSVTYGGAVCRRCRIFPLCHGGCSQQKLERYEAFDRCVKGLSEEERLRMVRNRVQDIVALYNLRQANTRSR